MASIPPTELHRDTAKARTQLRRKQYRLLNCIQGKLERRYKTPIFDDDQLAEVYITRGAPFDIDHDNLLDFDSRYFLAGSADEVDRGMYLIRQEYTPHDLGWANVEWRRLEPIECHALLNANGRDLETEDQCTVLDARSHAIFCYTNTRNVTGWKKHRFVSLGKRPSFRQSWVSLDDGKPRAHVFDSGEYFMWPDGPEPDQRREMNSDVPHAMATVYDSKVPRSGGLLRSELLMAIRLIKTQMSSYMFNDHRVCPVLVMSFHGRFSARIVQVCIENGRFIVRPSRLMNTHVNAISPDVRLLLQWLICRPVGDTRFPASEDELPSERDVTEEIGVGSLRLTCDAAV